jgi:hypothetical protein
VAKYIRIVVQSKLAANEPGGRVAPSHGSLAKHITRIGANKEAKLLCCISSAEGIQARSTSQPIYVLCFRGDILGSGNFPTSSCSNSSYVPLDLRIEIFSERFPSFSLLFLCSTPAPSIDKSWIPGFPVLCLQGASRRIQITMMQLLII